MSESPAANPAFVLIADHNSFGSSYLARVLANMGVPVVGPFATTQELDEWFAGMTAMPGAVVMGLDWLRDAHHAMSEQLRALGIPYLLVQNNPWNAFAGVVPSFSWPYGAFQVVEVLQQMMLGGLPAQAPRPSGETEQVAAAE